MEYYVYDTNVLLSHLDIVDLSNTVFIPARVLEEIEDIKTSGKKTEDVRYNARIAARWLREHLGEYEIVRTKNEFEKADAEIIDCARNCYKKYQAKFVTGDINCANLATSYGIEVIMPDEKQEEEYSGFKEVVLNDSEMAYLYEHLNVNTYNLLTNEYLIVKNQSGEVVDKRRWDGSKYQDVKFKNCKSEYFGTVKPYDNDVYQQCALDCLSNNQVTMLKGKAGTGKSYLALGYLFYLMEKNKIERIIVFCNTVATDSSAKLGYYPGTRDEKLLDSQIGNMLSSKLGGDVAVERLVADDKLLLLPMSDIRGYDTTNMNAGVYITEAQNMNISLMKLALQRIGQDCICIIDGDYNAQVDLSIYAGSNNGMRRMSKVFRGQDFYGEVELQNIYRSKIAEVAELM